ncbi:PREDICTED: cleft lip and palate transmembrane protein 1 homolog [Amphimedon queenslandica]|uniref:Cleft lip and palate transmembrane protein 1 n=1 Tax=Amphimedon queenslandica TaxID=400682 RepID=A0AAN0J457_AMPQE|nr:PREDICTED: cleft lip and palate transmembrane protein 1 homolog [Amphimedon queenslandica]|eukprot:XP_019851794.1 PREDICTED: cleft lip and palate transmembrane protein 1 homolog [Amphimedon queenslandica]
MSESSEVAPAPPATGGDQQQQQGPPRPGGWQMLKTLAIQMAFFYLITSYFRGGSNKNNTGPDGSPQEAAVNIFSFGEQAELQLYLTDVEGDELALDSAQLIWSVPLEYGNWDDGPLGDGSRTSDVTVSVPTSIQENGSWYVHVLLVKSGKAIDSEDPQYDDNALVHEIKLINRYRKQRLHKTANLLTGKADISPGSIKASDHPEGEEMKIVSYWHPNITVNVVYDENRFVKDKVPAPLDKYIQFNESGTGYSPIVYINDYWNLATEYMPMNNTVKEATFHLSYTPLSFFRFQLYASMTRDNPWAQWLGQPDQSDEDQDTLKETLLDTNPYLLGLTVIVSIIHSVFEFLAFKNGTINNLILFTSFPLSLFPSLQKLAFKYLGWLLFPLLVSYGVYSLLYHEHKGWYSFVLSMLYGFLLTFGFITMTPQLFINYKLKSVAHLPWRMLTYKALNTFIDDMFAFVIKMPTMYRIGCFRDDIVFFIYLYQRWIYRVDMKRVNEFGTSGVDEVARNQKVTKDSRQLTQESADLTQESPQSAPVDPDADIKSPIDKKED